jgi:hypothetical protein
VAKMCISGRIRRLERLAATRPVLQAALAPLTETQRAIRVVRIFRIAAERGGAPSAGWPVLEQRLAEAKDPALAREVLRVGLELLQAERKRRGGAQ